MKEFKQGTRLESVQEFSKELGKDVYKKYSKDSGGKL